MNKLRSYPVLPSYLKQSFYWEPHITGPNLNKVNVNQPNIDKARNLETLRGDIKRVSAIRIEYDFSVFR